MPMCPLTCPECLGGTPGVIAAVAYGCHKHLVLLATLQATDVTGSAAGVAEERLSIAGLHGDVIA